MRGDIIRVSRKVAGLCGIISPIIAASFIAISILLHPWFSWADNALSDLGALGVQYNFIFNLGLVLSGLAGHLFAWGLPALMDRKVGLGGDVLFGFGTVLLVLTGVFPEGTSPHKTVSVAFYGLSAIAVLTIGIDQLRDKSEREWGIYLLSVIGLALVGLVLITTIPYKLGAAIPEVIGAVVISEFSMVFGARLLGII